MNRFLNQKQKTFRMMAGVLIYAIVVLPVWGSTSWSAPATAQDTVELSAEEKENLVRKGVEQYKQGKRDQAQKDLELARTLFPENYAAPYYLGLIYLEQGKRSAAIAQWQQYVAMDPNSENALRIRKNLTLLLREEASDSARQAVAYEAAMARLPADEDTVAISAFNSMGSEDIKPLGKGMAALLIHDLAQVPDLQVVERVRLQALLKEMKLGTSGLVSAATAPRVGKLLKAKHVTSGSLADLERESLQIASEVMDADEMASVGTQEAKGQLNQFYELEKQIACQIIEDLDRNCEEMPAAFHKIHTKSRAALLLFAAGLDYLDQEKYDQARESFQSAIEKDPSFELAQEALADTPDPAMQFMAGPVGGGGTEAAGRAGVGTTAMMIAMAATHGVSVDSAGTATTATGDATEGVGITPVLGILGGAAAVAGVAAVSDDSSSGGAPVTTQTILGTWNYSGGNNNTSCDGTMTFIDGGTFNYTALCTGGAASRDDSGTWSLEEDQLTIRERLESIIFTGTVQGDSREFALSDPYYGTWTFRR